MQISDIGAALFNTLSQFSWRDVLEISTFSYATYRFLQWLHCDVQKQLLLYFYGYCGITFGAHYLKLTILSQTLLLMTPVVLSIFIVLHQHTLQKNFVALQPIKLAIPGTEHWIDELIRASLYAMNRSRHIIWVIERTQPLDAALEAPCLFYADLKKDLIDLLLDTQTVPETILWVQQTGKLVAINARWKQQEDSAWLSPQAQQLPAWQQQALLISAKTDAIIIHCSSITRLFTIITQEKSVDDLSAHPHHSCSNVLSFTKPLSKKEFHMHINLRNLLLNKSTLKISSLIIGCILWSILNESYRAHLTLSSPCLFL